MRGFPIQSEFITGVLLGFLTSAIIFWLVQTYLLLVATVMFFVSSLQFLVLPEALVENRVDNALTVFLILGSWNMGLKARAFVTPLEVLGVYVAAPGKKPSCEQKPFRENGVVRIPIWSTILAKGCLSPTMEADDRRVLADPFPFGEPPEIPI